MDEHENISMAWDQRNKDERAWQDLMRRAFVRFWKRLNEEQRHRISFQEDFTLDGKPVRDFDVTPDEVVGTFNLATSGTLDFSEWYEFGNRMEAKGEMGQS